MKGARPCCAAEEKTRGARKNVLIYVSRFCLLMILIAFTFMHLADAFIQSDLHCIQAIHFLFISMCVPWELNPRPFAANAMLYH